LFRKYCEGKNCYEFIGPEQKLIKNKIYSYDSKNSECYILREKNIKCNTKNKSVSFA
jgi:hypothetical protein